MSRPPLAAAVLAAACALPSASAFGAGDVGSPLPSVRTIHIKDFTYNPTPVTVHVGDRVTFVNADDEAHTVTAGDKSFDSAGLDSGGSWQHVFSRPGTYGYFCELHPYMKASIVVVPAAGPQH